MKVLDFNQIEQLEGGRSKDAGDCAMGVVLTVVGIIGVGILFSNPIGLAAGMATGLFTGMGIGAGLGEMYTSC